MFAVKFIAIAVLACFCDSAEIESKKSVKRGIVDDFGYPLGYNGWSSSLKLNPAHSIPILDRYFWSCNFSEEPLILGFRSNLFVPTAHDLSHIVAAAKKAAHDVFLAQQYVQAAKEDVLSSQRLIKEKEHLALIAHQKNEAAQQILRGEAQNVVIAQQKLAKVCLIVRLSYRVLSEIYKIYLKNPRSNRPKPTPPNSNWSKQLKTLKLHALFNRQPIMPTGRFRKQSKRPNWRSTNNRSKPLPYTRESLPVFQLAGRLGVHLLLGVSHPDQDGMFRPTQSNRSFTATTMHTKTWISIILHT